MTPGKVRANLRSLSVILQIVIAYFAVTAGISFISTPSGAQYGIDVHLLDNSPFNDYFIPGILLLVFHGLLNVACLIFTAFRWRQSSSFLIFQGWSLLIWILVQIIIMQDLNWLHGVCLITGMIWLYTGDLLKKHALKI